MRMIKTVAGVGGSIFLAGMLAASGSGVATARSGNPLVGHRKLVDPQCEVTSEVVYTPDSYAGFEGATGIFPGWHKLFATYTVSADEIWVHAGRGDYRAIPIDADHMKKDDGKNCIYHRAA